MALYQCFTASAFRPVLTTTPQSTARELSNDILMDEGNTYLADEGGGFTTTEGT